MFLSASVGLMVVHAKSAEPTEMPFWVWTQMGPRKPVLGGSLYTSGERQFFFGGGGISWPIVSIGNIMGAVGLLNFIW